MKKAPSITHLFLDIGGVLLSNGWDQNSRRRAAAHFGLNPDEMELQHRLIFNTYEEGKISLSDYLHQAIFYEKRPFTEAQFQNFMFAESTPYPEMLKLMPKLKAAYGLKITVVSNEGRELNGHRIGKFQLDQFVDSFISSCYVGIRKPDPKIFQLALDISQAKPGQVLYIENTPMFVEIAEGLGINGILHTDYTSTCAKLASFGLK